MNENYQISYEIERYEIRRSKGWNRDCVRYAYSEEEAVSIARQWKLEYPDQNVRVSRVERAIIDP